ncbi:glycosyltransferase [Paenibacillus alba]|uniref:glycosyltransferase n=1 Tax=Paenibacillus alba TaxID=1197127 RepID=UPI0015662EAD|nr:glycosyltransferase [Paenibacillus alba]NQX66761.1 glycosyltransferase [Paenibacillus alba]
MNPKVSVVIPLYNAEKFLVPCVESLVAQTLRECEFIFINDGSSDGSQQIIERFCKQDSRIRLINQNNQGVSMARNKGLEAAAGEYVGFVDADDYIDADMYETFYHAAKQEDYDVVITNFESELEGLKVVTSYPFPVDTRLTREYIEREILTYFLKSDQLNAVWNKLYKRKLIIDNDVKFPEKMALGEDGMFNMKFFVHAQTVTYKNYRGYHYREVEGSATRNILEKDYFRKALEVYVRDISDITFNYIDPVKTKELRAIKFIRSVMANIYVYLNPTNKLSFSKRLKYVTQMITNPYVKEALPLFYHHEYRYLGRNEKVMANLIRRKSTLGLYLCTMYSRFRSKSF